MKLKNTNFLLICCLAMSALTAKCEEKALPNNSTENVEDPDEWLSESHPYQTFSYSKDEVEFSYKFICSDIEAGLISEHLHGKGPNYARIIFENCRKKVFIVYSCKGFLSESFELEELLFADDCKNISPLDEKVLWANAISFLGRSFHNFEALNKIKHSNYFLKKHLPIAVSEFLKEFHANPILLQKGILESLQPQTNGHKIAILIRDNFNRSESELIKDPKYKEILFEVSNLFTAILKDSESAIKKDSPEYLQNINKDIRSCNLARVIFKNIIEENNDLIRAFPSQVCRKIKELCKNNVENINSLSDQDLEDFASWICEQAAEALSKGIVMPWDKKD